MKGTGVSLNGKGRLTGRDKVFHGALADPADTYAT